MRELLGQHAGRSYLPAAGTPWNESSGGDAARECTCGRCPGGGRRAGCMAQVEGRRNDKAAQVARIRAAVERFLWSSERGREGGEARRSHPSGAPGCPAIPQSS